MVILGDPPEVSGDASVIQVLDHGLVRLVDAMGSDLSVVRAARVSYDAAWRAGEDEGKDERLIQRLWRDGHTSPFEAVTLTFEVKAPIFVLRQWHRHRTWSYNELSARYRELPEEFYIPDPAIVGEQSSVNKQGRQGTETSIGDRVAEAEIAAGTMVRAFEIYRYLLKAGWPRELARSVLPVATYSHMFATVNLLNLFRFLTLRDHGHAQHEIRVYAEAMRELARLVAPVCVKAWELGRAQLTYEDGYREGGNSAHTDWAIQLAEEFDLDHDALQGPSDFIKILQEKNNGGR